MKGFGNQKYSKNKIKKKSNIESYKKQIINQAIQLQLKGKNLEASSYKLLLI